MLSLNEHEVDAMRDGPEFVCGSVGCVGNVWCCLPALQPTYAAKTEAAVRSPLIPTSRRSAQIRSHLASSCFFSARKCREFCSKEGAVCDGEEKGSGGRILKFLCRRETPFSTEVRSFLSPPVLESSSEERVTKTVKSRELKQRNYYTFRHKVVFSSRLAGVSLNFIS